MSEKSNFNCYDCGYEQVVGSMTLQYGQTGSVTKYYCKACLKERLE